MVDLRIVVNGSESEDLASVWSGLQVSLGVGYEQDTASLTLSGVSKIALPEASADLRFVADGAALGTFAAREIAGSSREGTITIECAAIDPEAALRKPRDRTWRGGTFGSMVRTVANEAGLTPEVNPEIGAVVLAARPQLAVSDLAFIQRLAEQLQGRLIIQEDRLVITLVDQPAAALPALQIDLRASGVWVDWRRAWSSTDLQRIEAAYVTEDGITIDLVEVGTGTAARRLPATYASRAEALAAAESHLTAGDVSRDYLEVHTGLTPTAQVLQPLELIGADDRIPVGFPPLVVHTVNHTLGRSVAETEITAKPADLHAS